MSQLRPQLVSIFVNIFLINPFLLIFILTNSKVTSLECYVCKNQENNKDKCIETVRTCELKDDRCLTEVRWGSTPYWDPTGEKQFYISKQCATKKICDDSIRNVSKRCDRIWFNDWECVECCNGDRCNYYITLGSQILYPKFIPTLLCSLFTYFIMHYIVQ